MTQVRASTDTQIIDEIMALVDKAKEWNRLSGLTDIAEIRAECSENNLKLLNELLERRIAWHESKWPESLI